MKTRVILIIVGGMCSDALRLCGHDYVKRLLATSAANVCSKTIPVSDADEIHNALFKKDTEKSLFDVLSENEKTFSFFESGFEKKYKKDLEAAESFTAYIKEEKCDFSLLYLGNVKEAGYEFGFMSEQYLKKVYDAFECIEKIREEFPLRKLMVMSDHGGHGKEFTGDVPSDNIIPVIMNRVCNFTEKLYSAEIADIAPTILKLLSVEKPHFWKGESLL